MSKEFDIEIISPDNNILSTKAEEIILPCFEGQVTILKDHISLITFLRPGIIDVMGGDKFYVEEGTVEFSDNKLLILSSTVQNLNGFQKEKINSMVKDAEQKITKNEISDKEKYILSYKIETLNLINQ